MALLARGYAAWELRLWSTVHQLLRGQRALSHLFLHVEELPTVVQGALCDPVSLTHGSVRPRLHASTTISAVIAASGEVPLVVAVLYDIRADVWIVDAVALVMILSHPMLMAVL